MMTWLLLGSGFGAGVTFMVVVFVVVVLLVGPDEVEVAALAARFSSLPVPPPAPPPVVNLSVTAVACLPAEPLRPAEPLTPAGPRPGHARYPFDPLADVRGSFPEQSKCEPGGWLAPGWMD